MSSENQDWKGDAPVSKVEDDALWGDNKAGDPEDFGGLAERSAEEVNKDSGDNTCRNCGQPGHFAKECPEPKVFKGTCRTCGKEGHAAAQCPDKPAEKCKNCGKEGHKVADCKENRALDYSGVEIKNTEDAWNAVLKADKERDLDEIREAIRVYSRAVPTTDWADLEHSFRELSLNTHIVAIEREVTDTFTLMDMQGQLDRRYTVAFQFSASPKRLRDKHVYPTSKEDNYRRLKNAGIPVDRRVPKCGNCGQLGHTQKACPEEKVERADKTELKCVNCGEGGHRVRDCPKPRADRDVCRNCKQPGHTAAECTEPRSAEGVECKHCSEVGHFAKDCPNREKETCRNCGQEGHRAKDCTEPKNPATVTCRNCDEVGHFSKDCPKPRDWSRVKCSNCGEMGHTKVRCKAPAQDTGFEGGFENTFGAGDNNDSQGQTYDFGASAEAGGDAPAASLDQW